MTAMPRPKCLRETANKGRGTFGASGVWHDVCVLTGLEFKRSLFCRVILDGDL